jgi:sodium/bile acid cotransporter 7
LNERARTLWQALKPDLYTLLIVLAVIVASLLPISGQAAVTFTHATNIAIGLLFFLHGARLSREAILAGLGHWRLHLAALAITFALFPLLGIAARLAGAAWLSPALIAGILYLAVLPSTIQSSVTYTAMAGGNVPAAVCSASLSNVVGVFLTPFLAAALIDVHGAAATLSSITAIVVQILLPFIAGHMLRPWIGAALDKRKALLSWFDRGVVLAIIYRAFSIAMTERLWSQISAASLAVLVAIVAVFLAVVTAAAFSAARLFKFNQADTVSLVYCGSQKSLASGAPMASILFPAATVGAVLLPLMLYHQLQLMLGAALARRFANKPKSDA